MSEKAPQFIVPADLVARSRPSGHSVPIVHAKQKARRANPYRNVLIAVLVALVALFGLVGAVYYSIEAGRDAGYHLACPVVGFGRSAHIDCHWEK